MNDQYVNFSTIANLENKLSNWQLKTIEVENALIDYFQEAYGFEKNVRLALERWMDEHHSGYSVKVMPLEQAIAARSNPQ